MNNRTTHILFAIIAAIILAGVITLVVLGNRERSATRQQLSEQQRAQEAAAFLQVGSRSAEETATVRQQASTELGTNSPLTESDRAFIRNNETPS